MENFDLSTKPPVEILSFLDALKPKIDERFENDLKVPRKQYYNAKRVSKRLQNEYPDILEVQLLHFSA